MAERSKGYLAVLGDIRRSRILGNRDLAQSAFLDIVEEINEEYRSKLAVPFSVSRGDEFQGLLSTPESVVEIIDAFDSRSYLFSFRYGLGWGRVGTAFRPRTTEMDGSCFLNAYSALEKGRKEGRWVTFSGAPEDHERIINAFFSSIQMIRDGWTTKQKSAVTERRGRPTQAVTAEMMGIDKSTLSKMLKAAKYKQLLEAEEALALLLRDYLAQPPGGERP